MSMFINKETADKDKFIKANDSMIKTVHVLVYTGNVLKSRDLRKLIEVVYKNFEDLAISPELGHNRRTIGEVLTSPMSLTLIAMLNDVIIGYLMANIANADNNNRYMHIQYLYTSPYHRGNGVATQLLNTIQRYALIMGIDRLSLTFDTYDKNLERFYVSNGFNYNNELRSYKRHDMMIKFI